jgi:cystathionine beta-lyase
VVIENPVLMTAYRKSLQKLDLEYGVNALGVTATIAAFNECDEWRRALMLYIRDNHQLTRQFSADYMPDVLIANADSTYFAWMDFRRLGMDVTKFVQILEQEAGLIVENGSSLGIGGEGFIRLNIACPRQVLEQGLNRIKEIYEKYHG